MSDVNSTQSRKYPLNTPLVRADHMCYCLVVKFVETAWTTKGVNTSAERSFT